MNDHYVYDMDWGSSGDNKFSILSNYRNYQYNLISSYIGKSILEIGTGDGGFTEQLLAKKNDIQSLLSIEPSVTLFESHIKADKYPSNFKFDCIDLFDLEKEYNLYFDTAILIHVLEHIKQDREALSFIHSFLRPGGRVLIEVPAMQWLFSQHDISIGHYRRYNKSSLINIVDTTKYKIEKIWYQDPIGLIGSLLYFKFKKIKLKSEEGQKLFQTQGKLYDNYIIPFEEYIEKYITFPFGLSLTMILKKIDNQL